ncbi:MAG: glycosyltransferase family 9 protein [Flavobacteriales bacterium]|nr:glycosyltransferase family 9 protein [Flavobacteriales bacterium]
MQRILIVRFSSIGDIVLTSPVMRALRARFPDADIRFLTKRAYAELVQPNPYLNNIFLFDGKLRDTIDEVRAFRPDVIIDLHHNLRTAILKAAVGCKAYSFPKLNLEKWLHVKLRLDTLPDLHIVDRYFTSVETLGVVNDGQGLDFFIREDVKLPQLPAVFSEGYVAVVVGAKFATKRIPEEKLTTIIKGLKRPVVLVGGPEDAEVGERLANSEQVFNACGRTSLQESARIIERATVVITPDTGMMHIAAAYDRPTISIWGNTVPAFGMTPYMPQHPEQSHLIEQKGLSCRPCSKIGFGKCPKKHFDCMMLLDTGTVISIAHRYI